MFVMMVFHFFDTPYLFYECVVSSLVHQLLFVLHLSQLVPTDLAPLSLLCSPRPRCCPPPLPAPHRPATCVPGTRPAPRFKPGGAASNRRLLTRPARRPLRPVVRCARCAAPPRTPRRPYTPRPYTPRRTRRAAHAAVPPAWPPNARAWPICRCASPPPPSPPRSCARASGLP